jgi:LAO/AO transport system kinase
VITLLGWRLLFFTMSISSPQAIAESLIAGNRRALARAITLAETGGDDARVLMQGVHGRTGRAHVIGVTGAPGAGKSTLVNALAQQWRRQGRTVGIVAVDPTSPFTGGAILGDRIRMQPIGGDPGVFVRSMASRGRLGGIAHATADAVALIDAAGFDLVVVETVGAGQSEVEIAGTAHTTVVVEMPGMGDDVQAIKAGILEIGDLFVVNKADREGAEATLRQLRMMINLGEKQAGAWTPVVLPAVSMRDEGIAEIVETIDRHIAYLQKSGQLERRERRRSERSFEALVQEIALMQVRRTMNNADWDALIAQIADRTVDPYTAAEQAIARAYDAGPSTK